MLNTFKKILDIKLQKTVVDMFNAGMNLQDMTFVISELMKGDPKEPLLAPSSEGAATAMKLAIILTNGDEEMRKETINKVNDINAKVDRFIVTERCINLLEHPIHVDLC